MKIVFFGTADFAIPALQALVASRHEVLAVVTQPDKKKGRNLKLSPTPVKVAAATHSIPVYQPIDASSTDSIEYLKDLEADLFVVIAFGQILKKDVLSIPKLYAINLHGSILPKYRGAAPTNWAVINGDRTSGVTIIKLNERMDEGDIVSKKEVNIDSVDTNITLNETLSELGAKLLLETVDAIEKSGRGLSHTKQDNAKATYAPKLKKEDGLIDWTRPANEIHNRVRGLLPWPGAYTYYGKKVLKILQTEVSDVSVSNEIKPGEVIEVVNGKGIVVSTGSGAITIKYLQQEGKKPLDTDSFVRGHKISAGYVFGAYSPSQSK